MSYTIQSAQWGNVEQTSAVIITQEVGAVAISIIDTPSEWAAFISWAGTNSVSSVPKDMLPNILFYQFWQQCFISGLITLSEALAAVKTGIAPAIFVTLVASLPVAQRNAANFYFSGTPIFKRNNPWIEGLRTQLGKTEAEFDAVWIAAAKL